MKAIVCTACALAAALFVSACSEIRYEAGRRPDVSGLDENLTFGASTAEDVRAALGPPSGGGMIMLPIDGESREVWSYYYESGHMQVLDSGTVDANMRRLFLFVYFDEGRYDGYMWFSSLPR